MALFKAFDDDMQDWVFFPLAELPSVQMNPRFSRIRIGVR